LPTPAGPAHLLDVRGIVQNEIEEATSPARIFHRGWSRALLYGHPRPDRRGM